MRKILIPVDFTDQTHNTINFGIGLSQYFDVKIELLYVVNIAYYGATYSTPADMATIPEISQEVEIEKIKSAAKSFELTIEQLKKDYKNLPAISTEIKSGIDADIIENEIFEKNIDILLLTGGEDNSFLNFIGNDNHSLIENANCPVMVVPNDYKFTEPKNVIYATDLSEIDIQSVQNLVDFIKPFKSNIINLHITKNSDFKDQIKSTGFKEQLKQKLNYKNIELFSLPGENIANEIIKFAKGAEVDLISVTKESRGFFSNLFHRSVSQDIADQSSIPVLIFHENS